MVVINHQQFLLEFTHHPVRSTKEAVRYLIDVADTPPQRPRRGGENARPQRVQTTPATVHIVPSAHRTWFSVCPCDLIWTLLPRRGGEKARPNGMPLAPNTLP